MNFRPILGQLIFQKVANFYPKIFFANNLVTWAPFPSVSLHENLKKLLTVGPETVIDSESFARN